MASPVLLLANVHRAWCGSTPLYSFRRAVIKRSCAVRQVFSFKVRGAFNKLAQLSAEELQRGVICASAGNHAQGVALAARTLVGCQRSPCCATAVIP